MAFELLTKPEELVKTGFYIAMIGEWGEKYPHYDGKSYCYQRVTWREQVIRDYYKGIMPASPDPDEPVSIDPDADVALQPRYYPSLYQARIGLSPDWQCYIRWPTNEYRMPLEEPGYFPVPTDSDKMYIGFVDSEQSPISHDPADMRFEFWFVRDWMPEFHAYVNSITDYVKLIMRFLINHVTVERVTNQTTIDALDRHQIPFKPIFHYSEYVKRGTGIGGPYLIR